MPSPLFDIVVDSQRHASQRAASDRDRRRHARQKLNASNDLERPQNAAIQLKCAEISVSRNFARGLIAAEPAPAEAPQPGIQIITDLAVQVVPAPAERGVFRQSDKTKFA